MFWDGGHHPHSDNFRKDPDLPETTYPLKLVQCQDCQFVQLNYVVSPEVLYDSDYLYESSITKTADKHWTEFVDAVSASVGTGKRVLDIGSNDGTLLSKFKAKGYDVLGIDPCKDITDIANARLIPTINALFSKRAIGDRKFGIITGSNVFAHIDNLDQTMEDVKAVLEDDGVFIFESPYLGDFIEGLQYDTVYHQHLSYLAVRPLVKFLEKFDMEIANIEFTSIHGGCFRCYIARKGVLHVMPIVQETIEKEDFTLEKLREFASRVEQNKIELMDLVLMYKQDGKKVVGISAPAKGMTLLNYTGVGKYLDFVTDVSKLKQGRFTPGSQLPIKSDKELEGDEIGLLLAWNFKDEIMKNVPQIKTWIIPNPSPYIT
jgi:SAM-dependent methyltransferase